MLFQPIAALNSITGGDKEKQDGIKAVLSNWVGPAGFELNLAGPPDIQKLKYILRTPGKQNPLYVVSRNF